MQTAVIFDLDGTLIDTLGDIAGSVNATLEKHGFPQHDLSAYRKFIGDGIRITIKRALPETKRDDSILDSCLADYHAHYSSHWNLLSRVYPFIPELLDRLGDMKIQTAIFSNKSHVYVENCVRHFLSKWDFQEVIGTGIGIPRKPDPAGALRICRTFGLPPEQVLFVGDMDTDMDTAEHARMIPVGVMWGYQGSFPTSVNTISSPLDLIRFIRDC